MKRSLRPSSFFPRSFLFFFPLHMGAEMITAIGLLNKASGFYGILSIFTGHPLTAMEWILNIFSLILLPIYAMSFLTVTHRNGLQMVLFSYLYAIDTVVCSIGFSIYFIVDWFANKSKEMAQKGDTSTPSQALSSITSALSTATSTTTTTTTNIALSSTPTISSASAAVTSSIAQLAERADEKVINKSATLAQETSVSIVITVALMLVRVYFTMCLLSYARQLVRQQSLRPHNGTPRGSWRAKLQQVALSFCESFWTGYDTHRTFSGSSIASLGSSQSGSTLSNTKERDDDRTIFQADDDDNTDTRTRLNQDF